MWWGKTSQSQLTPSSTDGQPVGPLQPLERAVLEVLGRVARRLTREELFQIRDVTRIRRTSNTIREAVGSLLQRGLIVEPQGKGQGLEITDDGRRRLSAAE